LTDRGEGDVTEFVNMDDLVTELGRLGRSKFLANLGRVPFTVSGRIERRDCYRRMSEVTAEVCLLAWVAAGGGPGVLANSWIPFTENELMDAALLREEVRGLVRVLRARDRWPLDDGRENWLAVAQAAADVSTHADRMSLAATSPEDFGWPGGDGGGGGVE
jgi:hypothetical protein